MSTVHKDLPQQFEERSKADPHGWSYCECLNKNEAEMLLDRLEANGYSQRDVRYVDNCGFTVRWRR